MTEETTGNKRNMHAKNTRFNRHMVSTHDCSYELFTSGDRTKFGGRSGDIVTRWKFQNTSDQAHHFANSA